jgi:hypothetical protein
MFALGSGGGGTSAPGGSFAGGSAQASATTDAGGVAVSPPLTANDVAGAFGATATTTAAPGLVTFALRNLPARPTTITAGAASAQSAPVGARFPVRPAVVVDDAKGNPVPGARVTFTAPRQGAGGRFAGGRRTVSAVTDASGIAVAPAFRANRTAGGYAVVASVRGAARPAAFAFVNLPTG